MTLDLAANGRRRESPKRLDVRTYDERERSAELLLSNDHIRAFSAKTFAFHGYPHRVDEDRAVIRYIDTMQEFAEPQRRLQTEEYSADERDLIAKITNVAAETSEREFGRRIRPWMGPLATIELFRAIQAYAKLIGKTRLRIFELGAGSGHLGALLIAAGHDYWSTDVSQGFYLWQSMYWRALAGDEFCETAADDAPPAADTPARVVHLPWWSFSILYRTGFPECDIVIADHMLGEVDPYALRFISEAANRMLVDPAGVVMCWSIGEPRFNTEDSVRMNFARCGLDAARTTKPFCFGRSQSSSQLLKRAGRVLGLNGMTRLEKIFDPAPPPYNESGRTERFKGEEIIPIDWQEAPLSYELYDFLGYSAPGRYKS